MHADRALGRTHVVFSLRITFQTYDWSAKGNVMSVCKVTSKNAVLMKMISSPAEVVTQGQERIYLCIKQFFFFALKKKLAAKYTTVDGSTV